jgi:deazaflavin-dependent oxidoreductase (nitroreductase family)
MASQVQLMSETNTGSRKPRVPFIVPLFNPIAHRLLGAGVPLGPNALLTVRGRKTGQPRTTPVAQVAVGGKRWIIGTFGEVNWVRNLRAAGEATLTIGRRPISVDAIELTIDQRAAFFKDVIIPYVRKVPFGSFLIGTMLGAKDILNDPVGAAPRHPVFELRERSSAASGTSTTTSTPNGDRL